MLRIKIRSNLFTLSLQHPEVLFERYMTKVQKVQYSLQEAASLLDFDIETLYWFIIKKKVAVFAIDEINDWATQIVHPVAHETFEEAVLSKSYSYEYTQKIEEPAESGVIWDFNFSHSLSQLFISQKGLLKIRSGFTHSNNYRSVTIEGEEYLLTPRQSEIIKTLHKALKEGNFTLSEDEIMFSIGAETSALKDAFQKKGDKIFKALIIKPEKGLYSLNI